MSKRFIYVLSFAAMAAVAGCTGKEISDPAERDAEYAGIPDGVPVTFTASFGDPTRTSVAPGSGSTLSVEWEAGDQIRILCIDSEGKTVSVIASAEDSGKSSSFAATVPEAEAYYAVYPASCASATALDSDGNITVTVPSKGIDGKFASASICVAKADASKNFSFRSAASIVKFTLDTDVENMQIANVAGGAIAGDIVASFDGSGVLSVAKSDNVTPIASTGRLNSGDNYVAVVAGTYPSSIAMRFDPLRPAFFDKGSVDCNIAHVVNYGNVQSKTISDYFITEDGTGDGSSWSESGNAATVMEVLHRASVSEPAHATLMRIWKSQGATFRFAAGTYVLGSDANRNGLNIDFISFNDYSFLSSTAAADTPLQPACQERVKIRFEGGYPAGGGARDTGVFESVLSGEGRYRIMQVRDLVDLTCDGMVFADAKASSGTVASAGSTASGKVAMSRGSDICGSAVYMSDFWENTSTWKTIELATRPCLEIRNCLFRGNDNSYVNSSAGGKSCIAVSKGCCHVTDTRFIGNHAASHGIIGGCGGAGYVENANRGEVFFDACYFEGNNSSAASSQTVNATVSYNNSKGTYFCYNNCTFRGNNDPEGYTTYGVIYTNRNVFISNCTFVEKIQENPYNTESSTSTRKLAVVGLGGNVLGCRDHTLVNNIILDEGTSGQKVAVYVKNDESGILTGSGGPERDARPHSGGGNLISGYFNFFYTAASGVDYGKHAFVTNRDRNEDTLTPDALGLVFDPDACVYRWSGVYKTFVPLSAAEVVTAMGSNPDVGDLFTKWLSAENRLYRDALGNDRGDKWTPGAYQAVTNN